MNKSLYTRRGKVLRTWLKQERAAAGLTMRDLASLLDVPFQFVSKVEKGERRLDVVEFVTYCEALGVDPVVGIQEIRDR